MPVMSLRGEKRLLSGTESENFGQEAVSSACRSAVAEQKSPSSAVLSYPFPSLRIGRGRIAEENFCSALQYSTPSTLFGVPSREARAGSSAAVPGHAPAGTFFRREAGLGDAYGRTPVHSGESPPRTQRETCQYYSQIQKKHGCQKTHKRMRQAFSRPHSRNTAHPRRRAGQAVLPRLPQKIPRFRQA